MASITFEGPNALNLAERSTAVASYPDEAAMATVQALCSLNGYQPVIDGAPNPVGPGTFAIQRIMQFCRDAVVLYQSQQAQRDASVAVAAALAPLDKVTIETVAP